MSSTTERTGNLPVGPGFMGKPLIEKLKLIALFALIGALIYFSKPKLELLAIGGLLTFLGAMVRVWAGGHLTRDQKLTTSGPYAHTRNPFYLGRLMVLVGFALMSGLQNVIVWVIFIAGLAFFFLGYMPRKDKREGGRLMEYFGEDYTVWKANVPLLFPRLTPYVMNPRPWSKGLFFGGDEKFSGNKELPTTIATLVLIALFVIRFATQAAA